MALIVPIGAVVLGAAIIASGLRTPRQTAVPAAATEEPTPAAK
jgi:hypothetical protein